MLQSSAFDAWLAWPGIVIGLLLVLGSLEFVGPFEESGWKLAAMIVPLAYIALVALADRNRVSCCSVRDLPLPPNVGAFALAALKDWCQLFGPGLIVPFGNGLILGYLMYKSGLVPRRMAGFAMIGGPLLLFGNFGVLFDWWDQTSAVSLLVIPEII